MLAWTILALACSEDGTGGKTTATGTPADTGGTAGTTATCTATWQGSSPADGEVDWFYRDPLVAWFSDDAGDAAFALATAAGDPLDLQVEWTDAGRREAVLTVDGGLPPAEDLVLTATVCGATTEVAFSTSTWGLPLDIPPGDLVGRTYVIQPSEVNYTKPKNLGALLQLYLDVPLLIGVEAADDTSITLLGALGELDPIDGYTQILTEPTWNFDAVDFTEQPYLAATSPEVVLSYAGVEVPIHDFWLEGVFASDGSAIGEGAIGGLVDTRNIAILFKSPDEPGLICDKIAAPLGVDCVPCPDGEPYCMDARAEDVLAEQVDGLTLVRVE